MKSLSRTLYTMQYNAMHRITTPHRTWMSLCDKNVRCINTNIHDFVHQIFQGCALAGWSNVSKELAVRCRSGEGHMIRNLLKPSWNQNSLFIGFGVKTYMIFRPIQLRRSTKINPTFHIALLEKTYIQNSKNSKSRSKKKRLVRIYSWFIITPFIDRNTLNTDLVVLVRVPSLIPFRMVRSFQALRSSLAALCLVEHIHPRGRMASHELSGIDKWNVAKGLGCAKPVDSGTMGDLPTGPAHLQ